jgi:predicted DNA-binding protein (MmcQ/YjbR family)
MATMDDLQAICKALPNVTEDLKWEKDYCFCVGGKMFLITCPDEVPVPATFKVSPEVLDELLEREGFRPAPYLAKHHWVAIDNINRLGRQEWKQFIEQSYQLVAAKLPKKKRG